MREDPVQLMPQRADEIVGALIDKRAQFLVDKTGLPADKVGTFLRAKILDAYKLNQTDPHIIILQYLNFLGESINRADANPTLHTDLDSFAEIELNKNDFYPFHGDPNLRERQFYEDLSRARGIVMLRIFHGNIRTREDLMKDIRDSIEACREYLEGLEPSGHAIALLRQYIEVMTSGIMFKVRRLVSGTIGKIKGKLVPPDIFSQTKEFAKEPETGALEFFDAHITPEFVLETLLNCGNFDLPAS